MQSSISLATLPSRFYALDCPDTTHKHVQHSPHLPCILTSLDCDLDSLHERQDQIIHFLAPAQLVCIQIQDDERDVGSQTRDAVV